MILTIIVAAVATVAVAVVGGLLTEVGDWYRALRKPSWQPPDWLFGPAWTVILALAAWAGVLAWQGAHDGPARVRVVVLFAINGALHMLWSPLFFKLRRPDWALAEVPFLWLSVAALMIGLAPLAPSAPWLLAPYLVWVAFAAWLNLAIVRLNGPFGRRPSPVVEGTGTVR
jgi:translocator protein